MTTVLPDCPACGGTLEPARVVREDRIGPTRDEPARVDYYLACGRCLSVARIEWPERTKGPSTVVVEATGAIVQRIRERMVKLREDGGGDVLAWMRDEADGWLLGVPEVFAEARPLIGTGGSLRLSRNAQARPMWVPPFSPIPAPPPPWPIETLSEPLSRKDMAAAKGDPLGGYLVSRPHQAARVRILKGTRMVVRAIRSRRLHLEPAPNVVKAFAPHPGFEATVDFFAAR